MKEEIDLSKTDKKFGRHDVESTLFVVGVFLFLVYLLNFGTVNDAIGRFFDRCVWLVKPYSTISFEKLQRDDSNLKYAEITTDNDYSLSENIIVSYDKHNIFLSETVQGKNVLNSIEVAGEIKDVRCFYSDNIDFSNDMKRDDQISADKHGLFIYCIYRANGKQMLSCHQIGQNNFERYGYIKPYKEYKNLTQDQAWDKLTSDLYNLYPYDPNNNWYETHRNEIIDAYKNYKHPSKFLKRLFDISFDGMEFGGFIANPYKNTYYLMLNKNKSSLEQRKNLDNKVFSSIQIPNSKSLTTTSTFYSTRCYVSDGKNIHFINISNDSLKLEYEYHTDFKKEGASPVICLTKLKNCYSHYSDCFIINDGKFFLFDPYNKKTEFLKKMPKPIDYGFLYYVNADSTSTIVESIDLTCVNVPYRFFHQQHFSELPDGYEKNSIAFYGSHGQYLVAGRSFKDPTETKIFLFSKTDVFSLNISGIDELVDEACITHENDKLTIYFMNKDSIYRWQNSQESIRNLKLRQLDLEPEPIKTIQTN